MKHISLTKELGPALAERSNGDGDLIMQLFVSRNRLRIEKGGNVDYIWCESKREGKILLPSS